MALELFFDNSFKVFTDDFTMYLCFITLLRINKKGLQIGILFRIFYLDTKEMTHVNEPSISCATPTPNSLRLASYKSGSFIA